MSVKWSPLKSGDIVDIVAPGFGVNPAVLQAAVLKLESWNLKARYPKNILSKHFLHSSPDEIRSENLRQALNNEDSKMIWCLRGGYGANRLIPSLAKMKKPKKHKLILGLSDVTSIQRFVDIKWKWTSLHGPLLDRFAQGKIQPLPLKELKELLFGLKTEIVIKNLKPLNDCATRVTKLEKPLTGGNLVTLQSEIGTPWTQSFKNKFLFLEEIGERGYRVDRILVHLEQAGILNGCAGVLLGDFTGGDEPSGGNFVREVLKQWAVANSKIPVWSGIPCGHDVIQRPLIFGQKATVLKTNNKYELRMSLQLNL